MSLIWFDLAALAFAVLTFRVLWRRGRTPHEIAVYDRGVRSFGLRLGVIMAVSGPLLTWHNLAAHTAWRILGVEIGTVPVVISTGLWFGFAWGQTMAFLFAATKR